MRRTELNESQLDDVEYAQRLEARMEAIETSQAEHLVILLQNTTMTKDVHERFNKLETGIVDNKVTLATALDEWHRFQILKADEGSALMASIKDTQAKHIEILNNNTVALNGAITGISDVLEIVTAIKGTKKTLGWIRKFVIWMSSFAVAGGALWTTAKTALSTGSKIQWPWS